MILPNISLYLASNIIGENFEQVIFPIVHFCVGRLKEVRGRANTRRIGPTDRCNVQSWIWPTDSVAGLSRILAGSPSRISGFAMSFLARVRLPGGSSDTTPYGASSRKGTDFYAASLLFSTGIHLIKHYTNLNFGADNRIYSSRLNISTTFSRPSFPPWAVGGS